MNVGVLIVQSTKADILTRCIALHGNLNYLMTRTTTRVKVWRVSITFRDICERSQICISDYWYILLGC